MRPAYGIAFASSRKADGGRRATRQKVKGKRQKCEGDASLFSFFCFAFFLEDAGMKCQSCPNPATVHLTDIVDGHKKELHLRQASAEKQNVMKEHALNP